MIVSSSDWTGYNDAITYQESNYYCMVSSGCVITVAKPYTINEESGDECVIVKITNKNNKP
jgi:hypothetical protein